MKTVFTLLSFVLILSSSSLEANSNRESVYDKPLETLVYICKSETAHKYHYSKNCRGLSACTHDIIPVTLQEARQKYKRTLCGWED